MSRVEVTNQCRYCGGTLSGREPGVCGRLCHDGVIRDVIGGALQKAEEACSLGNAGGAAEWIRVAREDLRASTNFGKRMR